MLLEIFISASISSYSFNTLLIIKKSSQVILESTKALKIKTFVVFNLLFVNNTILSCFIFFFLIIDLYFLIPAVIAQIFIVAAELAIPTCIPTTKAKAEIETHPVTAEAKLI